MVIWWILGILLGLIVLLLLLRVGVRFSFGESVSIALRIGPWTVPLHADSEKKRKKAEKPVPEKKEEHKKSEETVRPSFREIREALPIFWNALKKALKKTRRRMRVCPLDLSVTFGGEDPAKLAELYGWANTAMWTVMPQLERLLQIPDPHIHLEADFESCKTRFEGTLALSFHVIDLMNIVLTLAVPAARWYMNWKKQHRPVPKQAETTQAV